VRRSNEWEEEKNQRNVYLFVKRWEIENKTTITIHK
jgi:hypothetical protein